jgi:lysophospholipid acyltransferase (LPLAT)-like uncharacterized protein
MAKARSAKLEAFLGTVIATLIRVIGKTMRITLHDPENLSPRLKKVPMEPFIWVLWHNRVFTQPYFYNKYFPARYGTCMMSASGDGGLLAQVLKHFRIQPAHGSSSRRGAEALIQLIRRLREGDDICIIPDGPRGPRYSFAPGCVHLAMKSRVPILMVHYNYHSYWQLKSWDAFIIPKPFSKLEITLLPLAHIPAKPPEGQSNEDFLVEQAAQLRAQMLAPLRPEEIAAADFPEAAKPAAKRKPTAA